MQARAVGSHYDAVVVGSGPNGLAAAVTLAEAGRSVLVLEAEPKAGGGLRTMELTEPGFRHDICSTIQAMASISPFLKHRPLDLVKPPAALAHPLDSGAVAVVEGSVADTARGLGQDDAAYRRLLGPLEPHAEQLFEELLGPPRLPRRPLLAWNFGMPAIMPAQMLARIAFRGAPARALFAGVAAHGMLSLREPATSAFALVLLLAAHHGGWPLARGGSASVADALIGRLRELGGELHCGERVDSVDRLPHSRAVLLDLTPREILRVAGDRLSRGYRRGLRRYRYGPGAFKVDWALDGPIPWRETECRRAATVHLGGTLDEIALAESEVTAGRVPERPFVLLVQPTLFDPSRAPAGKHVGWAYCHVPNGCDVDMTQRIEDQVERFAPGFRDLVRARSAWGPAEIESHNANYVGGDINGGRQNLGQLFTRPMVRLNPYTTSDPRLFLCSSATPPGGGVHGMCGWYGAQTVLRRALQT
ncbi:MAG: NAD(P)/FAD-dependent oxidoreductase [Candidatus Dormibacteraeota bacterium]|nr:NAD(P)/FAD-dependent oxidoreductase [Candidatus Dormibacteraeota bacterium]